MGTLELRQLDFSVRFYEFCKAGNLAQKAIKNQNLNTDFAD